jgi:hypothetical protein
MTAASLPVLTIAHGDEVLTVQSYREACANWIAEIVADLPQYMGVPRLFIP